MGTRVTYVVLGVCVLVISSLSFGAPLIVPQCNIQPSGITHLNPDYITDPCWHKKRWILLGMSSWDADMNVRIVMSLACGSLIGFERRRADRAAGIRTMALVCLGACVFTVASIFAFIDGPMAWDASRVSAAIPSGVGFLGAASIWKGTRASSKGDSASEAPAPEVHGLTTATSVWLSSAVGILVGGALYTPALFTTATSVVYLRFAPRLRRGTSDSPPGADSGWTISASPDPKSARPLSSTSQAADLEALRVPLMQQQQAAPSSHETQLVL